MVRGLNAKKTGAAGFAAPSASGDGEAGGDGPTIPLGHTEVRLLPSGAVFWPQQSLLCLAGLHLGRAERVALEGGELQPARESLATLHRLEAEIAALDPGRVVCLGDSFDDLHAVRGLADEVLPRIGRMAAGRWWTWIAGSHDPGPVELPGTHLAELRLGLLSFRHVALPRVAPGSGEISAHYHPRARVSQRGTVTARRCFLADPQRVVLPAFGLYNGGLDISDPVFDGFLAAGARAWLLGGRVSPLPRAVAG